MRESVVEKAFVQRIETLGGLARKVQWVGRSGAPDRVAMLNGRTVWVELKRPKGKPEAHQAKEHARMILAGAHVLVIDTLELIDEHFPLGAAK